MSAGSWRIATKYPRGLLKIYVCRRCGFCQTFADDPGSIPIDAEHRTRLLTAPDSGEPYR